MSKLKSKPAAERKSDLRTIEKEAAPHEPTLAPEPSRSLFFALHHHRHGVSTGLIRAAIQPTDEQIVAAMDWDFEPDRDDEYIEVSAAEIVDLPPKKS